MRDKGGGACDIPLKPTGGKPVYCRSCFRENGPAESRSENFDRPNHSSYTNRPGPRSPSTPSSEELDRINRKLDRIMKALKIE